MKGKIVDWESYYNMEDDDSDTGKVNAYEGKYMQDWSDYIIEEGLEDLMKYLVRED